MYLANNQCLSFVSTIFLTFAFSTLCQAIEMTGAEAGTATPITKMDSGGTDPFSSTLDATVTGTLNQFDITDVVLLDFRIIGGYQITGSGDFNGEGTASVGGTLTASVLNGFLEMPNSTYIGSADSQNDNATTSPDEAAETEFKVNFNYQVPQSDWSLILGFLTFDIFATGKSLFAGSCIQGTGDCTAFSFSHDATFEFLTSGLSADILRTEFAYCTTPGENDCPELVVGVNAVDPSQRPIPAPATLSLIALGLAGFGWSRRKRA